jgi:hypothetical protein
MAAVIALGTFEQVHLREAWPTEDGNFTPWLAQAEIIPLLGKALNLELEVEAVEHWVGSFRADILARAIDETDHRVIIENQFGRTDHGHLGQILTYLAGIEGAKTVVWIAETIQSDHRAAIDWLNTNTTEQFSFFAIEIGLWRIGDSPPAPRFNVIASPNDWTKITRSTDDLLPKHRIRWAYWESFAKFLRTKDHPIFSIGRPIKNRLYRFSSGETGFNIVALISIQKRHAMVGLSTPSSPDKSAYRALHSQKDAIEAEFGEPLDWQERPGLIAVYRRSTDPADKTKYQDLHIWMFDRMERFQVTFVPRVKFLSLAGTQDTVEHAG